jgi:hypothetical protein
MLDAVIALCLPTLPGSRPVPEGWTESAEQAIFAQQLRVTIVEMPDRRQHDLWRERR